MDLITIHQIKTNCEKVCVHHLWLAMLNPLTDLLFAVLEAAAAFPGITEGRQAPWATGDGAICGWPLLISQLHVHAGCANEPLDSYHGVLL